MAARAVGRPLFEFSFLGLQNGFRGKSVDYVLCLSSAAALIKVDPRYCKVRSLLLCAVELPSDPAASYNNLENLPGCVKYPETTEQQP